MKKYLIIDRIKKIQYFMRARALTLSMRSGKRAGAMSL